MPIPLIWVAGAGLVGWFASDVADTADQNNKLFWVVAGAAGLYFAQKKGFLK